MLEPEQQILIEYRPSLHNPPRRSPLLLGNPNSSLLIIPGVKNYLKSFWDKLRKNHNVWKIVQSMLDEGILRVISDSQPTEQIPSLPQDLIASVALIKKTFSVALLNQWKDSDPRPGVQKAIAFQLGEEVAVESQVLPAEVEQNPEFSVENTTKSKTKRSVKKEETVT